MTLQEINNKFVYKRDIEQWGVKEYWSGLVEIDDKLVGDCEDYSIELKRNVPEFKDWNYYYCKLNGEGHALLISPDGEWVIDNNVKKIVSLINYNRLFAVEGLRKYKWYELAWKFGSAKVLCLWFKLKLWYNKLK